MKAIMHNFKKGNKDFIGAAFENNTEFVNIVFNTFDIYHMYWGQGDVDYDRKTGNITDKIVSRYSSTNIETSKYDIGTIIKKVWRPGLNIDVKKALEIDDGEMQRGLKSLKILSDRLNDILLFIEPDTYALQCHGHKIRELLILACTEVESLWKTYLDIAGQSKDRATTVNYVKLNNALYLFEYKLTLKAYPFNISYKPFDGWNASSPTQTLPWYNAYNETKHDKIHNFDKAKLEHCIQAIMAAIIMFCVRYSPYMLREDRSIAATTITDLFTVELDNPDKKAFYIPAIKSYPMASGAFSAPLASTFEHFWEIKPLVI